MPIISTKISDKKHDMVGVTFFLWQNGFQPLKNIRRLLGLYFILILSYTLFDLHLYHYNLFYSPHSLHQSVATEIHRLDQRI